MLQEVVLWADGRGKKYDEADFQLEHSHFCGNSKCTVPSHVDLEPMLENQRRVRCVVWVHCPHCSLKIPVCQHGPPDGSKRCIKFCPGFDSYEDFKVNGLHAENFDALTGPIGYR